MGMAARRLTSVTGMASTSVFRIVSRRNGSEKKVR